MYAELAYSALFNLLFGYFFIRKVMKLDKLSDNLDAKIPKKDWFKFGIIIIIIILYLVHIVLAYSLSSYWLSDKPNFSLIALTYIFNYILQSYIVLKLMTKGRGKRFKPNFFFWLFCMIAAIAEIIAVYVLFWSFRNLGMKMLQILLFKLS